MKIGVGIIGLGTVGIGTYRVLRDHRNLIRQRTGIDIDVVQVADVDRARQEAGGVPEGIFTTDAMDLVRNKEVQIVAELIGGIRPAYDLILAAAREKKRIVTANKALLAEQGPELFEALEAEGSEISFEAAVGGGIPVIRSIRDGLVGNEIRSILGILNGTSNYILTKMTDEGVSFDKALAEAQDLGYAEKDPTFDVEGIDAAHKLSILVRLAFGCSPSMNDIAVGGISKLSSVDISFAREFGYTIKLLAVAKEENGAIEARVEPAMIPVAHPLASVNGVYNAVYVVGDRTGPTLYYGRGAGSDPTASAVVSDIVDMARRIAWNGPSLPVPPVDPTKRMRPGEETAVPYYIRISAQDKPGVLSKISGVLSNYAISISAVIQKGRQENGFVPIVMLTHEAVEGNLKRAKNEIDNLKEVRDTSVHIRIEEGNL